MLPGAVPGGGAGVLPQIPEHHQQQHQQQLASGMDPQVRGGDSLVRTGHRLLAAFPSALVEVGPSMQALFPPHDVTPHPPFPPILRFPREVVLSFCISRGCRVKHDRPLTFAAFLLLYLWFVLLSVVIDRCVLFFRSQPASVYASVWSLS